MTIRKSCSLAVLGLALGTWLATPALATESGAYVGINLGQSDYDLDDSELDDPAFSIDTSDTAWSLAVGYRFSPYFGVELSYVDLGELTLDFNMRENLGGASYFEQSGAFTGSVTGPALTAVTAIPAGNFEFNVRLGLLSAKTEIATSASATIYLAPSAPIVSTYSESDSETTTEILYGLGMGYTFGDHFHIRADWITVTDVGDDDEFGELDIGMLTAGFQYRF